MIRIFIFLILLSQKALAIDFPRGVSAEEQKQISYTLGTTTNTKPITTPFPMGGYDGFEIGLTIETIDTSELKHIGNQPSEKSVLTIPKLVLAKGLYSDVDIFFEFAPLLRQEGVAEYGALLRWSFYQSRYFPINHSVNIYGGAINVDNIFNSESFGIDFQSGFSWDNFSTYIGIGEIFTDSQVIGIYNSEQVTTSGKTETSSVNQWHYFLGFTYKYSNYMLGLQFDYFRSSVTSAKLAYRF